MKLQPKRVLEARQQRSWTQDELAVASGLNLRTIQRIEKDGVASLQSAKALAAALDLTVQDLGTKENPMKSCPECGSNNVYRYDGEVQMYGGAGELLPELAGRILSASKACPVVCGECGHLRFCVAPASLAKMKRAKNWKLVE
jgi:transcriptional regulator with XRE-family HTH domain